MLGAENNSKVSVEELSNSSLGPSGVSANGSGLAARKCETI